MTGIVYQSCKDFLKKYPKTIAWNIKWHSKVVEQHINEDEVVLFHQFFFDLAYFVQR